jgi:glycosyltransferase involved in cell wall biosynthesis
LEVLLPALPPAYEVIIVDGGSVDGTVDVARRVRPACRIIQQNATGKGNALLCGFRAAEGDIIVTLDADGSADPREIPRFVQGLLGGAHYAKGSRFPYGGDARGGSHDITLLRKLGNLGLSSLSNLLFKTRFTDLCYGYNAFWRDLLPAFGLPDERVRQSPGQMQWGEGFEIEAMLSCRAVTAGFRIVEIPSLERERIYGTTNLRTFTDGARVLHTLLVEYRIARATRFGARHVPLPGSTQPATAPDAVTEPLPWFTVVPAQSDRLAVLHQEPDIGSIAT